jgi:hypothetical protein
MRVIGERLFVDGLVRRVYLDRDGRQYVENDEGNKVHGVWILMDEADEPRIVTRKQGD